jgi:hypothetical protein
MDEGFQFGDPGLRHFLRSPGTWGVRIRRKGRDIVREPTLRIPSFHIEGPHPGIMIVQDTSISREGLGITLIVMQEFFSDIEIHELSFTFSQHRPRLPCSGWHNLSISGGKRPSRKPESAAVFDPAPGTNFGIHA